MIYPINLVDFPLMKMGNSIYQDVKLTLDLVLTLGIALSGDSLDT